MLGAQIPRVSTFKTQLKITSIINQHLHLYKLDIKQLKTLKITPTCFDILDHHQGAMFFLAKFIL